MNNQPHQNNQNAQSTNSMPQINGNITILKQLIESNNHNINKTYGPYSETLLIHAIRNNWPNIIKHLIESGADINIRDIDGSTPLHIATNSSNIDIVKYLILSGADINQVDNYGRTPLYNATIQSNIDMIKYLVESGANIDACNANGFTSLHLAAIVTQNLDIVEYLLDSGIDKEYRNIYADTAADTATEFDHGDIAEFIKGYEPAPVKGVNDE